MSITTQTRCLAFEGSTALGAGPLAELVRAVKTVADRGSEEPILVFEESSSQVVDLDLRGTVDDVLARLQALDAEAPSAAGKRPRRGPGRPKLGVVSKEVTLLPRHWAWLSAQPGGASVTLRKLVETARRDNAGAERARTAQDAAYRFIRVMAGNEPGFEEATRSLFAADGERFARYTASWPADVRAHALTLLDRFLTARSTAADFESKAAEASA